NPFNPETNISYKLQSAGKVSLKVYDMLGREIVTLINEFQQAGVHKAKLFAQNFGLASGVYFYTLRTGDFVQTKKMMYLK
ncbi:MAG: T9SS type A sorting domain-containing protein, partial [Parachlamydiaceae bacterium]|nr:T9SS type A sorting domain-containing protein [Parachlamydiaceae bacterium]